MIETLTEIVCVIDRSGSMDSIRSDAIGGFNAFLKGQKEVEGEALLSLVLFNDTYEMVQESTDIQNVPALDEETYVPSGTTALLDAVGRTIDDLGHRLSNIPEDERAGKVIVAILTDGLENTSRVYTYEKVSEMIQHQKEVYKWEFIYLGANQDAFKEAERLSISTRDTMAWYSNGAGTALAFSSMNSVVKEKRMPLSRGKHAQE